MNQPINFIVESNQKIEGYLNIDMSAQEAQSITNGSVENMLCECLDYLAFDIRHKVLKDIISKLAFDGIATFKFVNATLLANKTFKNEIDSNKLSQLIANIKSLWTEYYILELFNSMPNIEIEKYYLDYVYTIITLKKKL
jgi:hypothetical protein